MGKLAGPDGVIVRNQPARSSRVGSKLKPAEPLTPTAPNVPNLGGAGSSSQNQGPQDTLIFVDVDGVLNVGVKDPGKSPVSFNEANVNFAEKLLGQGIKDECARRLIAVHRKQVGNGEQEGTTYAKFLALQDVDVSDVLVSRLAQIITAAGDRRTVVLSSNWRRPQHAKAVAKLEECIGKHLGQKHFTFDSRTAMKEESAPQLRLCLIGEYIAEYCSKHPGTRVRALVLEDFYISAIDNWTCTGGAKVDCVNSAEKFLRNRAPAADLAVKLCYTYDQFEERKLWLQVGTGLNADHLCQALSFLGHPCALCDSSIAQRQQEPRVNAASDPSSPKGLRPESNGGKRPTPLFGRSKSLEESSGEDAAQSKSQESRREKSHEPLSPMSAAERKKKGVAGGDGIMKILQPSPEKRNNSKSTNQSSARASSQQTPSSEASSSKTGTLGTMINQGWRRLINNEGAGEVQNPPQQHGKSPQEHSPKPTQKQKEAGGAPSLPAIAGITS